MDYDLVVDVGIGVDSCGFAVGPGFNEFFGVFGYGEVQTVDAER